MSAIEIRGAVIPASHVARLQRRHVWICNLLPLLGTVVAFASIPYLRPGWVELILGLAMWVLTFGMGVTVGFHRYFTHRSFRARSGLRYALAILGSMAGQGPVIAWVVTHRRHHEYSDVDGDPHSPHVHAAGRWNAIAGFLHAHAGWLWNHDMPSPAHYAPDLLRDERLRSINRNYYGWVLFGLAISALGTGLARGSWGGVLSGLLWVGFVRMFCSAQLMLSVNSVCHSIGTRTYATNEKSRNNFWLALPTFGEAWHNNHHAFPTSAAFGHRWWQIDPGWLLIRGFQALGLASEVRLPRTATRQGTE